MRSTCSILQRDHDEYTSVEDRGTDVVAIETCCPYVNVALERPIICGTTVSSLRRLLGREVVGGAASRTATPDASFA